jgi:AraC-like DNA-binding protein
LQINFFKPKNTILQKYIEGFYFLTKKENEAIIEYVTFPNNYSIISVYENTQIAFSENKVTLTNNNSAGFKSDLICHYKKPINIRYEGKSNEITFYFKPLGLNAFLEKSLCHYTNIFFADFIPFEDYQEQMTSFLRETDFEIRCQKIEDYWLSKLNGFDHPFLSSVLCDIQDAQKEYSIAELAKKYNITRQHLNKHFESNLCKSPSDFKKIQRFREALKSRMKKSATDNLTSLSYDMLFYDQSHLIKDFKSLTGLTPKKFFNTISSQEEGEINWLYV